MCWASHKLTVDANSFSFWKRRLFVCFILRPCVFYLEILFFYPMLNSQIVLNDTCCSLFIKSTLCEFIQCLEGLGLLYSQYGYGKLYSLVWLNISLVYCIMLITSLVFCWQVFLKLKTLIRPLSISFPQSEGRNVSEI